MFEIVNDDEIWFDGVRVARFEPNLTNSLRHALTEMLHALKTERDDDKIWSK